jgi:hypothetical protein
MRTTPAVVVAEHPVAGPERRHLAADRDDLVGELAPEDRDPRPGEPREEPNDEGLGRTEPAVSAIDRGRMDPHEQLVVLRNRPIDLSDANHVRRPVPRANGGLHGCDHSKPRSAEINASQRWADRGEPSPVLTAGLAMKRDRASRASRPLAVRPGRSAPLDLVCPRLELPEREGRSRARTQQARSELHVKGTETLDPAWHHGTSSYSWMRPPRTSLLRTRSMLGTSAWGFGSESGARRSIPRCGRLALWWATYSRSARSR